LSPNADPAAGIEYCLLKLRCQTARRELQKIAWHSHTNALDGIVYTMRLGWVQGEKVFCVQQGEYLDSKGLVWPQISQVNRRLIWDICDVEKLRDVGAGWSRDAKTRFLASFGMTTSIRVGSCTDCVLHSGIREQLVLLGTCWLARFRLGA